MALDTFHLFPRLPLELREEIYRFATPPRIVHVQELTEDRDKFRKRFAKRFFQLKLSPSLAHFAFHWRSRIPRGGNQPSLEYYGFTGPPESTPWMPTESTPAIPLSWLGEQYEVAWELAREGQLYSLAPIPPLLYTCSESRSTLLRWGYELAFSTRSNGPGTWFKFDSDILLLSEKSYDELTSSTSSSLLSGNVWDVGQFEPKDLLRVRKLALRSGGRCLENQSRWRSDNVYYHALPTIVRLFGGLEKLLLVEWTSQDLNHLYGYESMDDYMFDDYEPWGCVAVEEIDALLSLFMPNLNWPWFLGAACKHGEAIRSHKRKHGSNAELFEDLLHNVANLLRKDRKRVLKSKTSEEFTPWKIPKLMHVHVMREPRLQVLGAARLTLLEQIVQLKVQKSMDPLEQQVLARWNSKFEGQERTFAPSEAELEILTTWIEQDEILEQLQFEEKEHIQWHEQEAIREACEAAGFPEGWWDDCEAYSDIQTEMESGDWWDTDREVDPEKSAERQAWWIREGWLRKLDDPDLKPYPYCQLGSI